MTIRPENGTSYDGTAALNSYLFDDIGNRKLAVRDGRSASYTVNPVNQYTQRTVPGYVNVLGEATNAATVTVNGHAATRHSNYFRVEVPVVNLLPQWLGLSTLALLTQGTNAEVIATNTGNLYVPAATESFTYDADGNLTVGRPGSVPATSGVLADGVQGSGLS